MSRTAPPASPAAQEFLSLTTFRRSGEPVATPVWVAAGTGRHAGFAVVITMRDAGKVKRLRRDGRVEARPCDRRGRVAPGAPTWSGTATVVDDEAQVRQVVHSLGEKYGWQYRAFQLVERLLRRGRPAPRAGLVLALGPAGQA